MSCSFCNSHFHNIRGCRDPMIGILHERMKVIYMDMMNQYPYDTERHFNAVLKQRFNLRELRAVCVYFTSAPISRPKPQIINTLWRYYRSRISTFYNSLSQDEEQPWLETRRLPTQPDPIPDFARDLEEPVEEENDITWYIDRTPTPVSGLRLAVLQEPIRQDHPRYGMLRQLVGGEPLRISDFVGTNLMSHFDAVSGNIPFTLQVKKYDIHPVLEVEEAEEEGEEDCAICYESIKCMDLVKLNCEHKFCGSCIAGSLKAHNNMYCGPSCALCRTQMVSFSVKNPEIYNMVSEHCNL